MNVRKRKMRVWRTGYMTMVLGMMTMRVLGHRKKRIAGVQSFVSTEMAKRVSVCTKSVMNLGHDGTLLSGCEFRQATDKRMPMPMPTPMSVISRPAPTGGSGHHFSWVHGPTAKEVASHHQPFALPANNSGLSLSDFTHPGHPL